MEYLTSCCCFSSQTAATVPAATDPLEERSCCGKIWETTAETAACIWNGLVAILRTIIRTITCGYFCSIDGKANEIQRMIKQNSSLSDAECARWGRALTPVFRRLQESHGSGAVSDAIATRNSSVYYRITVRGVDAGQLVSEIGRVHPTLAVTPSTSTENTVNIRLYRPSPQSHLTLR